MPVLRRKVSFTPIQGPNLLSRTGRQNNGMCSHSQRCPCLKQQPLVKIWAPSCITNCLSRIKLLLLWLLHRSRRAPLWLPRKSRKAPNWLLPNSPTRIKLPWHWLLQRSWRAVCWQPQKSKRVPSWLLLKPRSPCRTSKTVKLSTKESSLAALSFSSSLRASPT